MLRRIAVLLRHSPPPPPQPPQSFFFLRFFSGRKEQEEEEDPSTPHFMVGYLVDSCGLTMADAVKASRHLKHLKSPQRPDAVLRLLREEGLCEPHIRRLVVSSPRVLVADAAKTLEPKIRALRAAGFSRSELAQLISANPNALRLRDAVRKIQFWRTMLGTQQKFLKLAKNVHLLSCKIDGEDTPILSFLRGVGMSSADIAKIVQRRPRLVSSRLKRIMLIVEQVKSLGVSPGSAMFLEALSTVSNLSEATLESKSRLLRSYGWSEAELLRAFQQFPIILRLSEEKLRRAMDFLLKEAGYQPSYVARRAVLLGYSIDRRLIPRFYVLQFLKNRGLPGGDNDLLTAMMISEKKFMAKYLALVQQALPGIADSYPEVAAMRSAI